jgi:hypothetical protein
MGPCEEMTINQASGIGNGAALIFVDDSDLIWYQAASGVLAQVELESSQLQQFFVNLLHSPQFSRNQITYQQLTGCS